jgi:pimeloyl-ACP methyl ester carboxylesterase/DNA-binding CsgD family transcriptional regulator
MRQQIRFCTAPDGVRLAYATVGEGPPLVKAAHWLSHLEYDWQSPVWRHHLEALASHHHLIRYDERGCGLSDWDVEEFSLKAWVRDLEAVVEASRVDRFALLGISQGGPVAIAYAVRHPEKVSHLILYGTYLRGRSRRGQSARHREETDTLNSLIRLGWGKETPAFRQVFASLLMPEATPEQFESFNELMRVSSSAENAAKMVAGFDQIDVTELAPKISVPTLVLHSADDARCPIEEGRLVASLIPGAHFVPLDSRNHMLLEQDPASYRFMEEIYAFLGVEVTAPAQAARDVAKIVEDLSRREREVLTLMALGRRNKEIARELYLSPKTVRNYVSILFGKLGVQSRGEAIVLARQAGLGGEERTQL